MVHHLMALFGQPSEVAVVGAAPTQMPVGSFVTHLECARCGDQTRSDVIAHLCPSCGGPYLVRYDMDRLQSAASKEALRDRKPTLWRYREWLPVADREVSLGEPMTPLVEVPSLGRRLGMPSLTIKDEGLLPTGSFKSRGASVGVSRAAELGVSTMALPTSGNAGAAWAAYGARAGIRTVVVMPASTPQVIQRECAAYGARLYLVDGSIADAGAIVKKACADYGWYDASTLKEPYRIEGKKTMGLELAEQLGWELPDVIVYPAGGGVGLIGMWKAFEELRAIGWIGEKRVRFVAVQATGCAPIVKAFREGQPESRMWPDPVTLAAGLRVPKALGDFLILRILYESDGVAVDVPDDATTSMMRLIGNLEGMLVCPEGAAAVAGAFALRERGVIGDEDRVIVFNTGSGLKYSESLQGDTPAKLERGQEIQTADFADTTRVMAP